MNLTQVLTVVQSGDIAAIDRLAAAGELTSLTNEDKCELTRAAAQAGHAKMLRHVFENHHLHSTDEDDRGRTILHFAAMSGDAETVAFAANVLGYDPMTADADGVTALEYAQRAKKPDAYAWLKAQLGFGMEDCYRNPILRGFHPDPSVVRVGNDYYMVNSTFVHFPGLPISHSTDLIHWDIVGHAAENLAWSGLEGLPGGYGYWAPDISYHKGRFWVVATLRRNTAPVRLQMITSAADPRGPWDKPKFLPLDGIDPSLFTDEDGRRYILLNPGAIMAEISDEGELLSEPEMIYYGSARIKPEGPHMLKKDGWYYLFLAEGGTGAGHMETVARSRNLRGPYVPCPYGPILSRVNVFNPIGRGGHGKPVMTPDGQWYMVYLCGRTVEGDTVMGRETAIDPMTWTTDGWPVVNELRGPSALQRLPGSAKNGALSRNTEWISPRNDPASFADITADTIRLKCGEDPSGLLPCSLLLRRQTEAHFSQEVTVDLADAGNGAIAGLMGYYDERSFFIYGLRKVEDKYQFVLRERIGEEEKITVLKEAVTGRMTIRVEGDGMSRRFSRIAKDEWATETEIRAFYLADGGVKGGKRFTGATVGLAAVGEGSALFTGYQDNMWE